MKPWRAALTSATASGKSTRMASRSAIVCSSEPPGASICWSAAAVSETAVFKVKKSQSTTGRYVDTDYTKCVGCHICKDVCPTGYIQMGLGE